MVHLDIPILEIMLEAMRPKRLKLTALPFVDKRLDVWDGAFTGNLTEVS